MSQRVLVLSPHPDDEAIGCGGAIVKHVAAGDVVEVIFLTSGEKGGHGMSPEETIPVRERESEEAQKIMGISTIAFWREPDGSLEAIDRNVKRLTDKIETARPDIIYVPHDEEDHPDHRAAAELVRKAMLAMSEESSVKEVWMYEVWTPLQVLNRIEDISAEMETKRKAIQAYRCQCDVLKFDEAILGLNRYRGEMHSWPGGDYAEVFKEMTR